MTRLAGLLAGSFAAFAVSGVAFAAGSAGQIGQISDTNDKAQLVFSMPGVAQGSSPDLSTVKVTVNGATVSATAKPIAQAAVHRTTILALDVSMSMKGARWGAARQAAATFLAKAPKDVSIGLVTFAGSVQQVVAPTTNHTRVATAIKRLKLAIGTELYKGIRWSVSSIPSGDVGSVLVLSDGRDTTGEPVAKVVSDVATSKVRVDVVALQQSSHDRALVGQIAKAGGGVVINANDLTALTSVFNDQVSLLNSQLLVTFPVPSGWTGGSADVSASIQVGGTTYSDAAVTSFPATKAVTEAKLRQDTTAIPVNTSGGINISEPVLIGGIAAIGVGMLVVALMVTGVVGTSARTTVADRLAPYGPNGNRGRKGRTGVPSQPGVGVRQQAIELTQKALGGKSLDSSLATRLDGAGLKLNSAEWVLTHAGIAVGAGVVGVLLSSGGILFTGVCLMLGIVGPWLYLKRKQSRRLKRFNSQLAETLTLISGSLSAGLSFTQALDTVVREGNEPVAGEFRRALVEQRLGVEIEHALEGVAERMQSKDFGWVVMAIRIQREVGGNLAELLLTVAATLREREYLRRQVQVLSAEGRLSAYILGGLPPGFVGYLALARPTYLAPMLHNQLGWIMIGVACVMMTVGVFWLKKSVKVEV
ncbi:MAG: type II secretion system F family protein [Nocardioidaceae bacterium]